MTLATTPGEDVREQADPESPVLRFDRVWLAFDDNVILRDVSFTLFRGHTKIILGASGAGKSARSGFSAARWLSMVPPGDSRKNESRISTSSTVVISSSEMPTV